MHEISDSAFEKFQQFIFKSAGITMPPAKKPLVRGRLEGRLTFHGLSSFDDYFRGGQFPGESQVVIDLLTTNETFPFREMEHFDFLRRVAASPSKAGSPFRVWSAACSSGEEAYSLAMVLDDTLSEGGWTVLGSDISSRVLEKAKAGHYPMQRAETIPEGFLKKYCLRGIDKEQGSFIIKKSLRSKVRFQRINLNEALPDIGLFDVIFLRNVMIYFSLETKQQIVSRVLTKLRSGGYLMIGHSEGLGGMRFEIDAVRPSVYRKR
jgi:chemotaxis protein methyltransferase CheR